MITPIDLQNLSVLIPTLYIPQSIEDFPVYVLSSLAKVIDLDGSSDRLINLQQQDPNSNETAIECSELDRVDRVFSELIRQYPVFSPYFHNHRGLARKMFDLVSESHCVRIEGAYWRFLEPPEADRQFSSIFSSSSHSATTHALYLLDQDAICLTVARCDLTLTERDRWILDLIYPHVRQAYQNTVTFTEIQTKLAQRDRVLDHTTTILLSQDGEVEVIGKQALQLINKYFITSSHHLLPEILADWLRDRILGREVSDHPTAPSEPLEIALNGECLRVNLMSDRSSAEYILLLEEHQTRSFSIEQIQKILGLSRRESEVLFWIAQDRNNTEISKSIGCRVSTVKKHIENIYHKLGVKSRTAAAIYALKQIGMLDTPAG